MYVDRWKTRRKQAVCTRVSPYVNNSIRKLTRGLGITISEYLRRLILQDLDTRPVFRDDLQHAIDASDSPVERAPRRRPDRPIAAIRKEREHRNAHTQNPET